jgi:hypothetical protein
MDVKGAKALSERLAQAARSVDRESGDSGEPDRGPMGRRHGGEGITPQSDGQSPSRGHEWPLWH